MARELLCFPQGKILERETKVLILIKINCTFSASCSINIFVQHPPPYLGLKKNSLLKTI